jgi:hypothetical protein
MTKITTENLLKLIAPSFGQRNCKPKQRNFNFKNIYSVSPQSRQAYLQGQKEERINRVGLKQEEQLSPNGRDASQPW